MRQRPLFLSLSVACLAFSSVALAGPSLTCADKTIQFGDSLDAVKSACGTPSSTKTKHRGRKTKLYYIDTKNQVTYELEFKGGKLTDIDIDSLND